MPLEKALDPEVLATVRRINDRFLRLGEPTSKHDVRVKLGRKRSVLDDLEGRGVLQTVNDNYLPRLKAFEYDDPSGMKYVRDCTESVLRALKELYERDGRGEYSVQQIEEVAQAGPEVVRIGLLMALDFRRYFPSYSLSGEGRVSRVGLSEEIIDFEDVDTALRDNLEWGKVPAGDGTDERAIPDHPGPSRESKSPYGKWEPVERLGRGGQGTVYLVRDASQFDTSAVLRGIAASLGESIGTSAEARGKAPAKVQQLVEGILRYAERNSPIYCGALKVLHEPAEADDFDKQLGRMKDEISALRSSTHPNVVRVLDANLDERWFVTEYFPEKALSEPRNRSRYRGHLLEAVLAFRPLVEAVADLHSRKLVHRDIKPENIFESPERGLVLGDFGLVFFADEKRSRVSETFENVGSRDWMPGWGMSVRVEDVRPSFDVFSLGKVLWSMIAGGANLRLWYTHEPGFELEKMFPDDPDIVWAKEILDQCVVEKESDCLPDAGALLEVVDSLLAKLRSGGAQLVPSVGIRCRFCGVGSYEVANVYEGSHAFRIMGLPPRPANDPRGRTAVLRCRHCGHLEWFQVDEAVDPRWWTR